MCCFNKVNLSAILLVHKRIINKDCTVKNNNEADTHIIIIVQGAYDSHSVRLPKQQHLLFLENCSWWQGCVLINA